MQESKKVHQKILSLHISSMADKAGTSSGPASHGLEDHVELLGRSTTRLAPETACARVAGSLFRPAEAESFRQLTDLIGVVTSHMHRFLDGDQRPVGLAGSASASASGQATVATPPDTYADLFRALHKRRQELVEERFDVSPVGTVFTNTVSDGSSVLVEPRTDGAHVVDPLQAGKQVRESLRLMSQVLQMNQELAAKGSALCSIDESLRMRHPLLYFSVPAAADKAACCNSSPMKCSKTTVPRIACCCERYRQHSTRTRTARCSPQTSPSKSSPKTRS